ncbi:speedy protein A isoform X1 [Oenanthe melanoleuca]|uniref:speedy protein A isoform X1 n=1 Tax=Oenanthe melanoleuca TaxID=2939378 RepID=UPI0024C1C22B|nr:speedy protein A isoform X1 [Oenanthe melanoleuca]XP_056343721.1 speedy protein A isoform X1 [Oenanthe melanoleuca]
MRLNRYKGLSVEVYYTEDSMLSQIDTCCCSKDCNTTGASMYFVFPARLKTNRKQEPLLNEMKHNLVCQTPPTVTVHVKASASRSHQQKKLTRLKRPAFKGRQGNCEKGVPSQKYKCPKGPCLVIQRQEMTAFFKLFDDDLIQDFLWMDCCCEIADKVMAIAPTHYIWQRERSVHHSGAVRNYNDQVQLPRGPSATPTDCQLCGKKGRFVRLGLSSSSSSSDTLEMTELHSSQKSNHTFANEKMLIDSPSYKAKDCQRLSRKRQPCSSLDQDKSMDWFTNNGE